MRKLLVLSLMVVAAVGCSKDGGKGNGGFRDSELVKRFKQAGGHAPSVAELTANGWCEMAEEGAEEVENLVFRQDGTMKFILIKPATNETQSVEATYVLNGSKVSATVQGQQMSANVMIATAEGETGMLLQAESGEEVVYSACEQQ